MSPKSKILITGTAGFIGFHLAKKLLELGHEIVGVDSITDYYDIKIKLVRNSILKKFPKYKFYKKDIADFGAFDAIVKKEKPKVIIHLAAQAGVRYSLINPWAYSDANYLGTLNVFESAKRNGVKKVIYASSSSVYGANKKYPFSEGDRTDAPISIYAATKKANELLAHSYHHLYGMEMIGLRFFTVYGEYGRPDLAFFKFAKNILLGKKIDIYNRGEMARDFTYIDDIVFGILGCLKNKKFGNKVYNLGGGHCVKLTEFLSLIEKNLGKKARVKYLPIQAGDVKKTSADIRLACRELGYKPQTSVDVGIKKFTEWFLKNKNWLLGLKD